MQFSKKYRQKYIYKVAPRTGVVNPFWRNISPRGQFFCSRAHITDTPARRIHDVEGWRAHMPPSPGGRFHKEGGAARRLL